ncbi:MAG: hypothetical protein ACTSVD_01010 [Candidatus Thorarchaeota archaeon]|nr:MAG: hypothetical protein DRO73_09290 [Candidatus Thorarchaeota archaeon]RLI59124.1 MAG: hypothetical protein DRO93_08800 [Candidatus Thorarchaeota archaeon]
MPYCELWLEMRTPNRAFRVALLVPVGFNTPERFERLVMRDKISGREFYVSPWYSGIIEAKDAMDEAAEYYASRSIQFLFFREIRPVTMTVPA